MTDTETATETAPAKAAQTKKQKPVTLRLNTAELTRELEWVARFVNKRSPIPVLQNVLLRSGPTGLQLVGTDLEISGATYADFGKLPVASTTIPAARALTYLKTLKGVPDLDLTLTPETGKDSASVTITHGRSSCTLSAIGADSFPEIPAMPETGAITLSGLEWAVPRTLTSISAEESRFTLNGALLELNDHDKALISTDGHRLSYSPIKAKSECKIHALICRAALNELVHLGADEVEYAERKEGENPGFQWFRSGHRTITARALTGRFPDYERVLPKEFPFSVTLDPATLKCEGGRVALFADERSQCVRFTVKAPGELIVSSEICETGKAMTSIPVVWAGPEWGCGLNWGYVLDFLALANCPKCKLHFNKPNEALEFHSGEWRYLVMPMRA